MSKLTANKCREQFEVWAINQCAYDLAYSDATKQGYRSMKTKAAWKVWQASREALEIALPVLEQERGEGEWIKCSDRMPASRIGVIVGCKFGNEWAMKWATRIHGHPDASKEGWVIPGASWVPTHWQPLPSPPEDA